MRETEEVKSSIEEQVEVEVEAEPAEDVEEAPEAQQDDEPEPEPEPQPERKAKKERKQRLKDGVLLWVLSYDDERDEYRLDGNHIERSDLPREAVHVTGANGWGGKTKEYLISTLDDIPMPVQVLDDGTYALTAADLYLFCVNNDIKDEFNIKTSSKLTGIDARKIIIWLFVGVAAICIIYAML